MKCKKCGYYIPNYFDLTNCPQCNDTSVDVEREEKNEI